VAPDSFRHVFDDDDGEAPPRINGTSAVWPFDEPSAEQHLLGHEGQPGLFHGFDPAMGTLIVASKTASPILVEQFRSLAATLHHAQVERQLKTVMVTSASVNDGKSLTASNISLTLSESYRRRVLLIDADLRRPTLHHVFQVRSVSGLNEGLKATRDEKLPLIKITETLTLLPAGSPELDPMGGLSSARMSRIIQEAASRYDWVIVDTPPVGVLADASIVFGMVNAAILVVRAGVTHFPDVEAAVNALGRDRILGVVFNAVDPSEIQGKSYYGHYYGQHD
jgi:protein-tyrosine kinase